jgi:hypothetical protein
MISKTVDGFVPVLLLELARASTFMIAYFASCMGRPQCIDSQDFLPLKFSVLKQRVGTPCSMIFEGYAGKPIAIPVPCLDELHRGANRFDEPSIMTRDIFSFEDTKL